MDAKEYPIKKAVITGGSGPIGLALIRKLLEENVEILLFQREKSPKRIYLPKDERLQIEFVALSELDRFEPETTDYDVFFHLGWENTGKREHIEDQYRNLLYSCTAARLAHRMGCHTFIGVGSQAEYGRKNEPLRNDMLCEPETAYGVVKLSACYATRNICNSNGMRHIWTRVLSGYGIFDNIDSMLISNILKALDGKPMVFSKGEQIWDFVYLDDIANALCLLSIKGKANEIYLVGSGNARPLKEYIEIMCEKLGKKDEMKLGTLPYGQKQVMYLAADISPLQRDTGWCPLVSFEEGIERVIEFYKTWKVQWKDLYWNEYRKCQKQ